MNLSDIEEVATQYLKLGQLVKDEYYTFSKVTEEELARYDNSIFDRRVREEAFRGSHITFALRDRHVGRCVGTASVFFLDRRHFEHLHFWNREKKTSTSCACLKKISLKSMADVVNFDNVVMHGYIESPLHTQGMVDQKGYAVISSRYVRFLIKLAKMTQCKGVPLLVEATGKSVLNMEQRRRSILDLPDLTSEQCQNIGVTRTISIGVDKVARVLGLTVLTDVFNERTLGKVYFLFPQVGIDYGRVSLS
jgi:hypothetical protein